MRIATHREILLEPLQKIVGAVERRQTKPILGNVLIQTGGGTTELTATDLEIELVAELAVDVGEEGAVTVPARKLLDICKALPNGAQLSMETEGDQLRLRSGRSRFTLSTLPASDFPELKEPESVVEFEIGLDQLKTLLRHTAFAMAQQDVRYYLNGLLLEITDGKLKTVATDGHRLALYELPGHLQIEGAHQVIIPRKGVLELLRLDHDGEVKVTIGLGSNHVFVNLPRLRFTSKLIDGRYPSYDRVIPKEAERFLRVNKEDFRQALLRTSILSNEKYRGVRLTIHTGALTLEADNPEHEQAEEEIEASYEGGPLEIGFNVNYLLDIVSVLEGDELQIALKDSNASALVSSTESEAGQYVVMPMRL